MGVGDPVPHPVVLLVAVSYTWQCLFKMDGF